MKASWLPRFFSYYKPYRRTFAAVMAVAMLAAGLTLLLPLGVRHITKVLPAMDPSAAYTEILRTAALMLGLVALHTACTYFVDVRGHVLGARMEGDLRRELFEHYQKLPFSFYDGRHSGQLMSRITNDLLLLAELYHHAPEDLIIYLVKFAGALVILLTIDARLTLLIFLFLPAMALFVILMNRRLGRALKRNKERIGDINARVEDNLLGIRVVKSFANEDLELAKFEVENNRFLESRTDTYRNEGVFFGGVQTFTQLITQAVVVAGGAAILEGSLDLADLLTFLLYTGNFLEPVQKFSHIAAQYQEGFAGFARFMEIMEVEPEIRDAPDAVDLPGVHGEVEFKEVAFRYAGSQSYVLKDLSFKVDAGETIALVGISGVGKTTLCSLIPRFYEAGAGQVLLDGVDVRQIRLESLRRNVGIVQQEVYLFAGTVFENIRYGNPEAGMDQVIAAARQANAHEFIQELPQGYFTDIGQRGVKLSGGQRQRLSLARVFLKDPPVLIFDEATSALDSESERAVQEALEILSQQRTTFIIAHRLSTIRHARRILVLTEHGIEEQGTHEELLSLGGAYSRLYELQFGEDRAEKERV